MEVRTERLLLRPLRKEDVDYVHRIQSSQEAMHYIPHVARNVVKETEEWLAERLARTDCFNFSMELLEEKKDGKWPVRSVIGVVGAVRTPEVGFMCHPDFWGKGLVTEALRGFLPLFWDHVSGEYDYAQAQVDTEHWGSRKVLEKCGFRYVETKVGDYDNPKLGKRDTAVYRLDKSQEKKASDI